MGRNSTARMHVNVSWTRQSPQCDAHANEQRTDTLSTHTCKYKQWVTENEWWTVKSMHDAVISAQRAPGVQHVAGPQHKALAALLRAHVAPHMLHAQQRFQRRRELPAGPRAGVSEDCCMVNPRCLHEQHFQQQPTYVLLTIIQSIYYAHYPLACNPTGPEATHRIAADPLPTAPHNNM